MTLIPPGPGFGAMHATPQGTWAENFPAPALGRYFTEIKGRSVAHGAGAPLGLRESSCVTDPIYFFVQRDRRESVPDSGLREGTVPARSDFPSFPRFSPPIRTATPSIRTKSPSDSRPSGSDCSVNGNRNRPGAIPDFSKKGPGRPGDPAGSCLPFPPIAGSTPPRTWC